MVLVSADTPSLEGVKQYYSIADDGTVLPSAVAQRYHLFKQKTKQLLRLLTSVRFHQCLVFCNQRDLAQKLCNTLTKHGWANRFISGGHDQADRQESMEALRSFQLRVLVSTDLVSHSASPSILLVSHKNRLLGEWMWNASIW